MGNIIIGHSLSIQGYNLMPLSEITNASYQTEIYNMTTVLNYSTITQKVGDIIVTAQLNYGTIGYFACVVHNDESNWSAATTLGAGSTVRTYPFAYLGQPNPSIVYTIYYGTLFD